MRTLRIGTRGSLLAKWQAEFVRKRLFAATGVEPEIVIIKTAGDKMLHAPVAQIGSKGIFIKELEEALLEETIDLAVHSVKDIPTDIPSRLMFPAVCKRDDVRDCLVGEMLSISRAKLYELLAGGVIESVKLEGSRRIPREALDEYIEQLRRAS